MFTLPPLPYEYDALASYIDEKTMEIHHSKHHQSYVDKLNIALEDYPDLQDESIEYLLTNLPQVPEKIRTAVRNNGGGHYNHSLFWEVMGPANSTSPNDNLIKAIEKEFGNFDNFKKAFFKAATTQFGSGWAWLTYDDGQLEVFSTSNQDSPISQGKTPLLTLDVWEHAYYLKYQNKRPEYVENWWNVVNWEAVAQKLAQVQR